MQTIPEFDLTNIPFANVAGARNNLKCTGLGLRERVCELFEFHVNEGLIVWESLRLIEFDRN
jgi:hypothetical protein